MSEWINAKERLPDVTCGHHLVYTPGIFQKQHIVWWNGDLPFNGCPTGWEDFPQWQWITHWMPLPQPPTVTCSGDRNV